MLRRNQVTSSSPLPSEETTSKQNRDSPTDFFSHSFSPESPSAHSASPLRGLVGISEGTCSNQDSCLTPSQPGFPVVAMEMKGTTSPLRLRPDSAQSSALSFTLHIGSISKSHRFYFWLYPKAAHRYTLIQAALSLLAAAQSPSLPCFPSACVLY